MAEKTATEIAHAWQSFRERCIELAIKSGAESAQVLDTAKLIATYIVTKDEHENKGAEEKAK